MKAIDILSASGGCDGGQATTEISAAAMKVKRCDGMWQARLDVIDEEFLASVV